MTSFNLNYFLRGPISKYSHKDMRASADEFGGDTYIQSITKLNIPSPLIQKELSLLLLSGLVYPPATDYCQKLACTSIFP